MISPGQGEMQNHTNALGAFSHRLGRFTLWLSGRYHALVHWVLLLLVVLRDELVNLPNQEALFVYELLIFC